MPEALLASGMTTRDAATNHRPNCQRATIAYPYHLAGTPPSGGPRTASAHHPSPGNAPRDPPIRLPRTPDRYLASPGVPGHHGRHRSCRSTVASRPRSAPGAESPGLTPLTDPSARPPALPHKWVCSSRSHVPARSRWPALPPKWVCSSRFHVPARSRWPAPSSKMGLLVKISRSGSVAMAGASSKMGLLVKISRSDPVSAGSSTVTVSNSGGDGVASGPGPGSGLRPRPGRGGVFSFSSRLMARSRERP